MHPFRIVIDTNVFISAIRSQFGAAYQLFSLLECGKFELSVSVPLLLEYESVAKRLTNTMTSLTHDDIDDFLDYICSVANQRNIYYLWRPYLRDPKDEMVLELAVSAGCEILVSYNKRDFAGVLRFGIRVLTPQEFLLEIGAAS